MNKKEKRKISIYLSHPIWEKPEGKIIEAYFEKKGFRILNPFDYKSSMEKVIEKDLKLISEADLILAYLPVPNIGVSMEIMFAWMIHKPIFVIPKNFHPWIVNMKAIFCATKETAYKAIRRRFK